MQHQLNSNHNSLLFKIKVTKSWNSLFPENVSFQKPFETLIQQQIELISGCSVYLHTRHDGYLKISTIKK